MTEDTLQFEKAELETPTDATCVSCKMPVGEEYFEVNGHIVCASCKVQVEQSVHNGAGGFVPALALGALAAAGGAAVWYAIVKLTGYEIGLIAVGVGVVVGMAVRKGGGGRGGPTYQALAMFLTYAAMVAYYVPAALQGLQHDGGSPGVASIFGAIVIAFAAPFLAGFQNVIGIVILGFALYEAWKLNKRSVLAISGPFKLKSAA